MHAMCLVLTQGSNAAIIEAAQFGEVEIGKWLKSIGEDCLAVQEVWCCRPATFKLFES